MKYVFIKRNFVIFALFLLMTSAFTQITEIVRPDPNNLSRNIILDAQIAFEDNDYPKAFKLTQDAKDKRQSESNYVVYTLETALRKPSAQRVGKDIEQLLWYFRDRQNYEVISILEYVLADYSLEYFDYSIDNVVTHLKDASNFPEADFLLGKLYFIEGELEIAENFFISAYENRELLDIDGVQYDILYSMAELYDVQSKDNALEEVLLLIAVENPNYFNQGQSSPFLHSVNSAIKSDMDADKFFLLFRDNYYPAIDAWYLLTKYYYEKGETQKALDVAILFSLVSLTRIDEVVKDRDINYTYTTLDSFFTQVNMFTDIRDWAVDENVWEGFYLLALISSESGYADFARGIFTALATHCPQRQWRVQSENALANL